ncbi:MAG: aminotransferase class IV [Desulfocapsaceae bacterium]
MAIYYVDGDFVEEQAAKLPLSDLIILRGYGVFDFLRTYGGRPFHLEDHIKRLQNSARLIGLACPWSSSEIIDITLQTIARNDYPEANIRLLITGGDSEDSISPGQQPRLVVTVGPVKRFPEQWYRDGVKIITARLNRYIPGAKSIDYIRAIVTLNDARAVGAVESVYVDIDDHVLEGTTSNLFAVIGGRLVTPAEDILPGITRDVILELVKEDFQVELRNLARAELLQAEEIFLASSNKEVLPVSQVDDQPLAPVPGPVTGRVLELFRAYTDGYGQA